MAFQVTANVVPTVVRHNHCHYRFHFNNISLQLTTVSCNLDDQITRFNTQKTLKYHQLFDQLNYLAYVDEKFCITTDVISSKRASDARTTRDFPCDIVPIGQMLPQLSSNTYITEADILDIFNPDVVSTSTVKQGFDQVTNQLDTIVYGALGAALNGSNTATILNDIVGQLKVLKEQLQAKSEEISTIYSRKITNELPISGWLHAHLANKLDALGFIVDTQSKLTKPVAPVNEYVSSQPALLLYHSHRFLKTVAALSIKVTYPCIDILCGSDSTVEFNEVHMTGMTSEVKVENVQEDAVNECFYNMFGQGASHFCKGMLVKKVTMYGIVVAAHKPNEQSY